MEEIGGAAVVRGAGAGPYGAGALTGVVALQSPDAVPGGAVADLQAGNLGYKRAAAVLELAPDGPVQTLLGASGESSHGWAPVRYGYGAADRELTLHDWSGSAQGRGDLGGAALNGRLSAYQEDRGAGQVYAGSRARGGQGSLTAVVQPSVGTWGWRLQGWASGSDLKNTSASIASNRQSATLANDQYATPAYGVGANAALRRMDRDASLEFGADVRVFNGESRERLYTRGLPSRARVAGGGEAVAGLYAEAGVRRGPWLLAAGARADGWIDYDSHLMQSGSTILNQTPGDRGGAVPTGRLGVRRDLASDLYVRTAAYTGFRPATLNELHRPFRVGNDVTLANAALSPERLYGAELGIGGTRYVTWDLDGFFNQLADAITNVTRGLGPRTFPLAGFVPAGGTLFERENAGRVNAYGLEGEARRQVAPSLSLAAAFSYTHAQLDGGSRAPQLTGLRPAQTPRLAATASAEWRVAALSLFTEVRYEGARFDDDQNTRPISAGTGVTARLEYRLATGVRVFLDAQNLLDANIDSGRTAANVVSYDAPRIVSAGLTFRR